MQDERLDHPAVVRFCHWLVALAVPILIASGLEVFAAFPSFADKIPASEWPVTPLTYLRAIRTSGDIRRAPG